MGYNDADWETINTAMPGIKEFKENMRYNIFLPNSLSERKKRAKVVQAFANGASKQIVEAVINHAPAQEVQGIISRYKKAIIISAYPFLKVEGKVGSEPEIVKPGTEVIINGNTWTFKGFKDDGYTPVVTRPIKR